MISYDSIVALARLVTAFDNYEDNVGFPEFNLPHEELAHTQLENAISHARDIVEEAKLSNKKPQP